MQSTFPTIPFGEISDIAQKLKNSCDCETGCTGKSGIHQCKHFILTRFVGERTRQALAQVQNQDFYAFIVGNVYEIRVENSDRWNGFFVVVSVGEDDVQLRNVVKGKEDSMRKELLRTWKLVGQ